MIPSFWLWDDYPWIIDEIDEELAFTAICYSLNTFLALQDKPNCKVILCGGSSNPITAFSPLSQQSELDNICPNKAFISAAGVSIEYGATCFNFDEILLKHRAMAKSQYKILVADHSKFGKIKPASIGTLAQFDALVTDRPSSWILPVLFPTQCKNLLLTPLFTMMRVMRICCT